MAITTDIITQYFEKSERLNLLQGRIREFIIMLLRNHEEAVQDYDFDYSLKVRSPGLKKDDLIYFDWTIRSNPEPWRNRYEYFLIIRLDGKEYIPQVDFLPSHLIERAYEMLPLIVDAMNGSNPPSEPHFNVDEMVHNFLK